MEKFVQLCGICKKGRASRPYNISGNKHMAICEECYGEVKGASIEGRKDRKNAKERMKYANDPAYRDHMIRRSMDYQRRVKALSAESHS